MLVGYLGSLCWAYNQIGLTNTLSARNSLVCRGSLYMEHNAETESQDPTSTPQRQTRHTHTHTHTHPATRRCTHSRTHTQTLTHTLLIRDPQGAPAAAPTHSEAHLGQRVLQLSLHPVGGAWYDPCFPALQLPMFSGSRERGGETRQRGSPRLQEAGAFPWGICSASTPPERLWLTPQPTGPCHKGLKWAEQRHRPPCPDPWNLSPHVTRGTLQM